jgi:hypothetical protein
VDRGLPDRLHHLSREPFNPFKHERDAFRVLLYVLAVAAVVLVGALVIQAL